MVARDVGLHPISAITMLRCVRLGGIREQLADEVGLFDVLTMQAGH